MRAYAGYLKQEEKLNKSASGGAARALYENMLDRGGVVFGVCYDKDFRSARFQAVEEKKNLLPLLNTKYIYSEKKDTFREVEEYLAKGREVLFVGLGCDVAGVKSYLQTKGIDMVHLYTVELICHGPAPKEIHEAFMEEMEKRFSSNVVEYAVRYKPKGWTSFWLRIVFENGKVYEKPFEDTDFGYCFSRFPREACTHCRYKGEQHPADLTIGDYWGITDKMAGYNPKGVSLILEQTDKGHQMVEDLMKKEDFFITEADASHALAYNPLYAKSREANPGQEVFMKNLEKFGLHKAVSMDKTIFYRVKWFLRKVKRVLWK